MSNAQLGTLTILGGPLAGHQLVLDQAVEEILIGSDPDCAMSVDLPGVSPVHARIWIDHEGAVVHDTRSPRGTYLNDDRVEERAPLKDGDILWLGAPGEPESVMIQVRLSPPPPPSVAEGFPPMEDAPFAFDDTPIEVAEPEAAPVEAFSFAEDPAPAPAADPVEAFSFAEPEPAVAPGPTVDAAPAVFEEPAVAFDNAPVSFEEPAVAFEEPPVSFEEPAAAFEEPPVAFGDPDPPAAADAFAFGDAAAEEPVFEVEEPGPKVGEVTFDDVEKPELDSPWEAAPAWQAPAPEPEPQVAAAAEEDVFDVAAEEGPEPPPPVVAAPPPAPPRVAPAPAAPAPAPAAAAPAAPRPVPARGASPSPRPAAAVPARAAAPAPARAGGKPIGLIAGVAAAVLLLGGAAAWFAMRTPSPTLTGSAPNRVSPGAKLTLTGENFASDAAGNTVTFGGNARAKVLQASATTLQVEVPDGVPVTAGKDTPVPVTVTVGEATTEPLAVNVFLAPRLVAAEPGAAIAGDEILLKGSGFGAQPTVTVGGAAAELVEVKPDSLRIKVPAAVQGAPGSSVPVIVKSGAESTAPLALLLGRLPMVLTVQPAGAMPGDVVTLGGHGFATTAPANEVRFGDTRALVASANPTQLTVVVPRVAASDSVAVSVRVPGSTHAGEASTSLRAAADPPGFRFVAEPLADDAGHVHAALVSPLGVSFVLSDAGGRSAGERAAEALARLNGAAEALASSEAETFALKARGTGLVITLTGRDTPILDVTPEDAAAHGEPWAGGAAPTAGRLAAWWQALLQDHAAVLVRGARPSHAAAAGAAAAKPLADVGAALRQPPFTSKTMAALKPATRDGLKTLAARVPDGVAEPAGLVAAGPAPAGPAPAAVATPPPTVAAAPTAPPTPEGPAVAPINLSGEWFGSETLGGLRTGVTVTFAKSAGSIRFERAVPVTVSMTNLQERKGKVSYRVALGASMRYYTGTWDGEKVAGTISSDAAGKNVLGRFEIKPVQ